ncbi:amino acid adenylation domain-containing protein [Aliiglaciecola sp. LCG003]|uniref:amino acid adenylation domain-containing protein n=1 Tax=Aliiglaciecola sp. LCG003 TaxID=3053655 RepID=UPI0025748275|nr:amino acid adenylation domain-containing protein [Aliiglaciecola sp. LCG003]WJG11190.1 amino acid adenylation domain-containing protein [Aliiglaciecola sp. LCG003]
MNTTKDTSLLIHRVFEMQARTSPNSIAVRRNDQTISYRTLNSRANHLATNLQTRGVVPGDVVALWMSRTVEVMVAKMAILKCGAAYLPLDKNNPIKRTKEYLQNANAKAIIYDSDINQALTIGRFAINATKEHKLFTDEIEENLEVDINQNSKAYVMFTSGSSGKPKGVVVPHRAVVRLVRTTNYIEIASDDVFFSFAPMSFDASTFELWGALLNGATLALYSGESIDPNLFASEILEHNVTTLWLTAALFQLVASRYISSLKPIRTLLVGGDVVNPLMVNRVFDHFPDMTIINGYGPTENTTFTCCHRMTKQNRPISSIPIGTPISGTSIHILDTRLMIVPDGEVGELYTSGLGVALGYVNQVSGAFFENEQIAHGLIYRTGDLVKRNARGEIEFIGRIDNQVKIRGFRVSLEEIQHQLLSRKFISNAVVTLNKFDNGDQQLVAHIELVSMGLMSQKDIKNQLSEDLPNYMIPDLIYIENSLPITLNGKVDRNSILQASA